LSNNTDKFVVTVGEEIMIRINSNPTTGYRWQPQYDDNILDLNSHDFVPVSEMIGSSGVERFRFKARKAGKTSVKMIYKRPWDNIPQDKREFSVTVI
jgi:inhibitor of cysteine peptidase